MSKVCIVTGASRGLEEVSLSCLPAKKAVRFTRLPVMKTL